MERLGASMRLEARNLFFKYTKGPWIVENFSISLESGEILGLNGPSGCGKTTIAKLLAGYEKSLHGEIFLDERSYPLKGFHPVQYIAQHPEKAVNPRWQMKEILQETGPLDPRVLEELGILPDWLTRWPNELSGGELQRFCVARAITPHTRFLIADEITTMLDAITQAQIWHFIVKICRERSIGLLVVSHDAPLLERLCTKTIEIS